MPAPFYGIENSSAYPSLPKANLANERRSQTSEGRFFIENMFLFCHKIFLIWPGL